jgi:hypothetical protein
VLIDSFDLPSRDQFDGNVTAGGGTGTEFQEKGRKFAET